MIMPSSARSELLTPAEACQLAGIGPTTLKRWADNGVLSHVKTAGGHRRFLRADLERYLQRQTRDAGQPGVADENPWIQKLVGGSSHDVEAELLHARGRLGGWYLVAQELAGVLGDLGERWSQGKLSILDEHIASERLLRGLARIGEALPTRPNGPRALLACAEEEVHSLGLALAELCLRELGWTTLWAGTRTPTTELARIADSMNLRLVALSASALSKDRVRLARTVSELEAACHPRGVYLALGGDGLWPDAPRHAKRFRDFATFHRFAANVLES
ncbi:MAG: helix-turn-helix domain-containing protein [Planctomycetota bacterium]